MGCRQGKRNRLQIKEIENGIDLLQNEVMHLEGSIKITKSDLDTFRNKCLNNVKGTKSG
jgi:hypothetical protein